MPKQLSLQVILDAIAALAIDVPIMRAEQDENGAVTIYLYGGAVHHWPPEGELTIQKITDPFPYEKPPVTRTALQKSQRAKKSQTKA